MPVLGVITCEVLEREMARLLASHPALERVTVIEDARSARLVGLLNQAGCRNVETIAHIGGFRPEPADGIRVLVRALDLTLHKSRKMLRHALASAAREMARHVDALLLGYGACGNAVEPAEFLDLGIPVFMPMDGERPVDDCIALCLGGRARYREEQLQTPGTFFMTPGWSHHWRRMFSEGLEGAGAERALQRLFRRYERSLLVVTPVLGEDEMRLDADPFARMLGLRVEVREGNMELLENAWERATRELGFGREGSPWPRPN